MVIQVAHLLGRNQSLKVRGSTASRRIPGGEQANVEGVESAKHALDDISGNVGQPIIAARMTVGEPGVVEAHEMEDRGVEVMNMNGVGHRADAVLVGRAVDMASP